MNLEQEFKQMLLDLQSVGDVYEYPCTAWGVLQEYKDKIQSRIEELEKENTSLKQDAERYRWLRESSDVELWNCLMQTMPFATDLFDRRIDSAMQSEKGDNND